MTRFKIGVEGRYVPSNTTIREYPEVEAVVYIGAMGDGRPTAMGYSGKRGKADWTYSFRDQAQMDKYIAQWVEGLKSHKSSMAARKTERMQAHDLPVGTVFYTSYGYDQTHVEFYQVVETTARTVKIRQIRGKSVTTGYESGRVTAQPGKFVRGAKTTTHVVNMAYNRPSLTLSGGRYAWVDEGKSHYWNHLD